MTELDNYYLSKSEPQQGCLLALREIILGQDERISESLKWNCPCFSFEKKMFCFLMVDKHSDMPYLLFADGKLLDHPLLERRDRKRMKSLTVDPNVDIPVSLIDEILTAALALVADSSHEL